ncbi:MAG: heavy metal-binding domain-containing protein [Nanoarchaeota archaeon]|nr:heavy metal-binding domain-containing protein [Nanoarchaeota archaeon]MBU0978098.1 heavy metal-binding domain-containing protein [Nanoarchaeota archaeon]
MIVTTGEEIPGKKISEILGVVQGNTVRAKNIGRDIAAGFKNIVGGEIKSYTDLLTQAREEAYNRMVNHAIDAGADAIIGMRFATSAVMAGAAEIVAFGTAVKVR